MRCKQQLTALTYNWQTINGLKLSFGYIAGMKDVMKCPTRRIFFAVDDNKDSGDTLGIKASCHLLKAISLLRFEFPCYSPSSGA